MRFVSRLIARCRSECPEWGQEIEGKTWEANRIGNHSQFPGI
jgi:hypothetical protein